MNTTFLLMAQYGGQAVIPLETVCRDYFAAMPVPEFSRKVAAGTIRLPIVRMEASQKAARGIHIQDLAEYLDARRAAAVKEAEQLHSTGSR
ncbi:pyocin activator PrtN family protein [Malikia sp.]|uniref:pyocin activator PrtN family protein n=1 Tax=Malikia sp. TaxID=2070706 RepID=UPI00262164B9|nr:pyocin activator PrtN family protein [Malikia sp.]MDD2730393.1 pyocin activator PrtN family protein [Malikia sp.]